MSQGPLLRSCAAVSAMALLLFSSNIYADREDDRDRGRKHQGGPKGELSVLVLGSGGPAANDDGRASAGYLIFTDGRPRILMDAGGGTFQRLAASGVNIKDLEIVLLSHLHIDHMSDLPAMVKTIYFHARNDVPFPPGRTEPIRIYGPDTNGVPFPPEQFPSATSPQYPPTTEFTHDHFDLQDGIERYLHLFTRAIRAGQFNYNATDLSPDTASGVETILVEPDGLTVKAIGVHHGPAPTVAYRIEYKGNSVVFSGDTNSQTDNMVTIARNADLLIYDTAIMDNIPDPTMDAVFYALHTTPTRMGEVAAAASPRALMLSHITTVTDPRIGQVKRKVRAQGYHGRIIEAKDLMMVDLGEQGARQDENDD